LFGNPKTTEPVLEEKDLPYHWNCLDKNLPVRLLKFQMNQLCCKITKEKALSLSERGLVIIIWDFECAKRSFSPYKTWLHDVILYRSWKNQ